jgi:hypothetical protein
VSENFTILALYHNSLDTLNIDDYKAAELEFFRVIVGKIYEWYTWV